MRSSRRGEAARLFGVIAISSGYWTVFRNDSHSGNCLFFPPSVSQVSKTLKWRSYPLTHNSEVNGTHLSADSSSFLEKRRHGLIRFTNALVRHPVLGQEQLVVMFLTVPTVSLGCPHDVTGADCADRNSRYGASRPQSLFKTNSSAVLCRQISKIHCPLLLMTHSKQCETALSDLRKSILIYVLCLND